MGVPFDPSIGAKETSLRHNYFDSFVDTVLGVNVDVAGAFLFRFDAAVFRHCGDLCVCGLVHDRCMLFDWLAVCDLFCLDGKCLAN